MIYYCSAYTIIVKRHSKAPSWLHALSTEPITIMIINHVQRTHDEYVNVPINKKNVC